MKFASGVLVTLAAVAFYNDCYATAVLAAAFGLFLANVPPLSTDGEGVE